MTERTRLGALAHSVCAFALRGNRFAASIVYLFVRRAATWALLVPLIASLGADPADYRSVQRKFDLIESGRLKAGARIQLTPAELNAYVEHEVPLVTGGVRHPKLRLVRPEVAEATALINFAELRRSQGDPPGWLMSRVLDGEHAVSVTARIRSSAGNATVDILGLEISGLKIEGAALDFLIEHFLLPLYPDAAIGRPFELGDRMERLDVRPAGVGVVIGH